MNRVSISSIAAGCLADRFRQALRRQASSVFILAVQSDEGGYHGLALTSVSSLSFEPHSVLACVNRDASAYGAVKAKDRFGLSLLGPEHEGLAGAFASSAARDGRFVQGKWTMADGCPVLDGAPAALACRKSAVFAYGTHDIVVGEILDVRLAAGGDPLIYRDGKFSALT